MGAYKGEPAGLTTGPAKVPDMHPFVGICALTADGLNLAGVRRLLELQQETRQLRAELAALRARAVGNAQPEGGP